MGPLTRGAVRGPGAAPLKRVTDIVEGARGPFFVTPHAVRRYIERVRPGLTYEQALGELVAMARGAHLVKELASGLELWRGPPPRRLRFRVSPGCGGLPQLVTVLEAFDGLRRGC